MGKEHGTFLSDIQAARNQVHVGILIKINVKMEALKMTLNNSVAS